ncbi:hypothetical protein PF002_g3505 [Phytophthora fragariae]|uniref:Uncharacterized protein n=1 Tax=Phytophthora fragariae TaxID=53985 RepID=A0A6A4A6L6_9STRA|nr:hypothetical protein PF002_g3505 [Phytophthora fragariae]
MPRSTVELLHKRAEHNEGIISTLEKISLHQEEQEKIEVIGTLCRKLRVLYLRAAVPQHGAQQHKIEGLQSCEFLNKLDLTVNFVD